MECNNLKIEYQKLEEDNSKNLKIIQQVLNEAGKDIGEHIISQLNNNINYNASPNENDAYSNNNEDNENKEKESILKK